MRIVLGVAVVLIGAAIVAVLAASSSWHRATRQHVDALQLSCPPPATFDAAALSDAPPPVARYLRAAIHDAHPFVRGAVATQEAEFFINGGWHPLTATQHFSVSPPGFVWDARIEMAPLMPVFVRDGYVNQHAMMQAAMFGIYPLANQVDTPQLNAGALQRLLGESVWFPTALVPSSTVTWTARDERSAVATLTDGPNRVSLLFEFGDNGLPLIISGDRFKEDQGQYALAPWKISCGEHAARDGLTIPLRCEVAWIVDGVAQPYWRGRIASIEYQYELME